MKMNMIKIQKFLKFLLIVIFIGSSCLPSLSQKKQPSKKSGTGSASTNYPSLKKEKLEGTFYELWALVDQASEMYMQIDYALRFNEASAVIDGMDMFGKWNITGNKLSFRLGDSFSFNLSSENGGKTFTGTMTNSYINKTTSAKVYDITDYLNSEFDPSKVKKDLEKNGYTCWLGMYKGRNDPLLGVQVKATFTADDDESGTFKITGESKLLTHLGVLKGEYTFGKNELTIETSKMEDSTPYEDFQENYLEIYIGKEYLPSIGNVGLYLYCYKK